MIQIVYLWILVLLFNANKIVIRFLNLQLRDVAALQVDLGWT